MQEDPRPAETRSTVTNGAGTQVFTPRTPLGKKLWELRKKHLAIGSLSLRTMYASKCFQSRSICVARQKRSFMRHFLPLPSS